MPRGTIGLAIMVTAAMLMSLSAYYLGGPELFVFIWSALVIFSVAAGASVGAALDMSLEKYYEDDVDGEIQPEEQ